MGVPLEVQRIFLVNGKNPGVIYIYIYSRKVLFTLGEVGLKRISSLEEKNYKSWYRMGWNELLK